jgi:WhiB family transcriptional regulator, redox-sensing transcriptional regulator
VREPRFYENPACATVGGDFWFPENDATSRNTTEVAIAKSICRRCPHKTECAEWGIQNENFGIWGGLNEGQRRLVRRQRRIIIKGGEVA